MTLRVLALCESAPTIDARHANGSTLISHHLLSRLPDDIHLDLLWTDDGRGLPSAEVLARSGASVSLAIEAGRVAATASGLPRATKLRTTAVNRGVLERHAEGADVVYVHGLHVFALALGLKRATVAHEVDPWSAFWAERAQQGPLLHRLYDRWQSTTAARIERRMALHASTYLVVNRGDAISLSRRTGRTVEALPNGHTPRPAPSVERCDHRVVFAGSLDYEPNIDAALRLGRDVFPRVRTSVPEAELVIAGRHPTPEVQALAERPATSVLADVPDLMAVLASASVAAFCSPRGRGTKNTVLDALAAGCALVAHPAALRGIGDGPHAVAAPSATAQADAIVALLRDPARQHEVAAAGQELMAGWPTWDDTAAALARHLHEAAR